VRIGLVIGEFNPRRGGAELWTFEFARRLLARGHEVHVVAAGFGESAQALPVVAHQVECSKSRLGFAAAAESKLRTLRLDVIHDQGMGWCADVLTSHGGAWQASTEAKARDLPRWAWPLKRASMRLLPRYRTFRRLAERQFANPSLIVVALSRMVARDFLRFHPIRPEQVRLVYNGADTERFSPERRDRHRRPLRERFGVGGDDTLFVFVGNDYHRKGLPAAVEALARLRAEGRAVRLLVVGGKPYRRVAYRVGGPRGAPALDFTGQVDDAAPYYAAADAFVLPTLYDPCSLSVLEAAAGGLPCITTRLNGAAELLTDGREGYVLDDPLDTGALADRMRRLLDADLRRRMGRAARQLMLRHTLDHNCDELLAIYNEVAARRRAAA
jgi:UDP-glucose:(heptosyl)LPS alpha-1,3-glucosyltransferase